MIGSVLRARLLLLPLLLAAMFVCGSAARAQSRAAGLHAQVTLVADRTAVTADPTHQSEPPHVGLLFQMDPGWHVYWTNAGDSGLPPSVHWTLPAGVTAGPLQFPTPQRLPLGPLMDYGYENQVLFPAELHITAAHTGVSVPIAADVTWLVCRQACVPGKGHLTLSLPVGSGTATPSAPLFASAFAAMPQVLPAQDRVIFQRMPGGFQIAILTGKRIASAQFFPADPDVIDNAAMQTVTPRSDGALIVLKQADGLQGTPQAISGVLRLPDGNAYFVRARPGVIPAKPFIVASSSSLLRYVLFALGGGMLLNLMPCVFPVLFIKALALVKSTAAERHHMRQQGIAYTVGILVSFWIVVGILLVLRAGGRHLGWGFQFQSPIFVALIALLLFFMGLSLAGMFDIGLSVTSAGSSLAHQHGLAGSFFTGVLAMVVATPCAAPFLGAAIGFALVQPAFVAFVVFTSLGLGLALPYLALAFHPAWTRLLPRPGAWMEVLKQATSVMLFATVIWLVWVFAQLAGSTALIGLLSAFLLLAIAGWVMGRWPARRPATAVAATVIALAVLTVVSTVHALASAGSTETATGPRVDHTRAWQPFTPDVVARYQAEGKPVFVDFTADWCLSCQVNERLVLELEEVRKGFHARGVALVRADWTRHDSTIAQTLASLGRSSVPTYALYPGIPGAPARVLPEVLTPGIVLDALKALPNDGDGPRASHTSRGR